MRRYIAGLVTGLLFVAALATAQTNPQIQIAINQLTTGITPFTALRNVAGAYINWGGTSGVNGYGFRDNGGTIQFKNSGGGWVSLPSSGTFPTGASYWTRVTETDLSNETALGTLATGLILNTGVTGQPVIYTGTTCTNQFVQLLNASGVATCASVALTTMVTGVLPVANGGTGLASGTSGGVLAYTAAGTLASSAALTANRIVLGGGAGAVPTVLGSLGTTTTVLHGNAAGAPSFGAVVLTTDVSGILPGANGGTGNGFFAVAGPAASLKTYTFPNASTTVLTTNAAITAPQGGTGQTTYVIGDLLQANTTTTLARLAATSTGNALISGGVGTVSAWGKIGLTTHISGTLGPTNGGTGFASYTTGDLLYANSGASLARLNAVAAGSYLRAAGVGTAPVWSTTILPNAATTGDLLHASAANTYTNLAAVAVGQVLTSAGVGTAPAWSASPRVASLLLGPDLALSSTAPTVGAGCGTTPVIVGTAAAFRLDVGTGGTATDCTLTLPAATTGWNCHVENLTGTLANRMDQRTVQVSSSTTTAVIENQTITTGAALAWTASDVVAGTCVAF